MVVRAAFATRARKIDCSAGSGFVQLAVSPGVVRPWDPFGLSLSLTDITQNSGPRAPVRAVRSSGARTFRSGFGDSRARVFRLRFAAAGRHGML